ncbi:MAG: hypothetical protein ACLPHP_03285 [Candidatus Sulfotelmatobacter sp.]
MGLVYILAGFLILIFVWSAVDQIRLSRHRGVSRESFIGEFTAAGIPAEIPGAVCDHYVSLCVSRHFSIAPDDSFPRTFRQAHEDVDDDAEDLVKALKMELPTESVLRQWETPLETLRDMVLWLNWIRERQA